MVCFILSESMIKKKGFFKKNNKKVDSVNGCSVRGNSLAGSVAELRPAPMPTRCSIVVAGKPARAYLRTRAQACSFEPVRLK